MEKVSLTPRTRQVAELVRTLDLRTIPFLGRSIRTELAKDHIVLSIITNIGLNIAVLFLKTLHALHKGVTDELRTREQWPSTS